jgi:hypothetical protein
MPKTVLAKRGEMLVLYLITQRPDSPKWGGFYRLESLPRENHADLKYPLSGGKMRRTSQHSLELGRRGLF